MSLRLPNTPHFSSSSSQTWLFDDIRQKKASQFVPLTYHPEISIQVSYHTICNPAPVQPPRALSPRRQIQQNDQNQHPVQYGIRILASHSPSSIPSIGIRGIGSGSRLCRVRTEHAPSNSGTRGFAQCVFHDHDNGRCSCSPRTSESRRQ